MKLSAAIKIMAEHPELTVCCGDVSLRKRGGLIFRSNSTFEQDGLDSQASSPTEQVERVRTQTDYPYESQTDPLGVPLLVIAAWAL